MSECSESWVHFGMLDEISSAGEATKFHLVTNGILGERLQNYIKENCFENIINIAFEDLPDVIQINNELQKALKVVQLWNSYGN